MTIVYKVHPYSQETLRDLGSRIIMTKLNSRHEEKVVDDHMKCYLNTKMDLEILSHMDFRVRGTQNE